ncbi:hypothetical protein L7F22_058632 [Adiantum nelumboides]|nr:hypothetical protein [Adiantum nelumboides]
MMSLGRSQSPHPSDLSLGQQIDLSRREAVRTRLIQQDRTVPAPSPVLTDRFNRQHTYLRISLTEKCNLRCRYCMPAEGVPLMPNEEALTGPEIARLARLFVSEGVRKIRLTGGEPTLRRDLIDIVADLGKLRGQGLQQIGITTNGITLTRQLRGLFDNGLTHLNVSLDTLDPLKFELLTRRPAAGLRKVLDGIDLALHMGALTVKVNVVILRGVNDNDDVLRFVEWAKNRPLVVRFIEYMPFDGNRWRPEKLVPYQELLDRIKRRMTEHFCGTCNRLRITADGKIKVCLFGNAEVSLRDALRVGLPEYSIAGAASDEELLQVISAAVGAKHARHGGLKSFEDLAGSKNRAMIRIGG